MTKAIKQAPTQESAEETAEVLVRSMGAHSMKLVRGYASQERNAGCLESYYFWELVAELCESQLSEAQGEKPAA